MEPLAAPAGNSETGEAGIDFQGALFDEVRIAFAIGQQIHLIDDEDGRLLKDEGVFERLIVSFRDAQDHGFEMFAKVK